MIALCHKEQMVTFLALYCIFVMGSRWLHFFPQEQLNASFQRWLRKANKIIIFLLVVAICKMTDAKKDITKIFLFNFQGVPSIFKPQWLFLQ